MVGVLTPIAVMHVCLGVQDGVPLVGRPFPVVLSPALKGLPTLTQLSLANCPCGSGAPGQQGSVAREQLY